jgi:Tol biopolymer transport system component
MAIHVLDLKSKRVVEMPGTRGLWSPRWSPDGRRLLAITTDSEAISISDAHAPEWKELLRLRNIDKATWSPDSKFILFNGIDQDKHHWLYRLSIATGKTDKLASLEDFDYFPPDSWFGVDSDGSPLALMASRVDELFKLKCDLP